MSNVNNDRLPRCVCSWENCRIYQKAYTSCGHPVLDGVVRLKFIRGDVASIPLKASVDRTLNVPKEKRQGWRQRKSSDGEFIIRYNIARHHFTEAHIQLYLDNPDHNWTSAFSWFVANKFLFKLDPKETTLSMEGPEGDEAAKRYIQCPNVCKDHLREQYLQIMKKQCEENQQLKMSSHRRPPSPEDSLMLPRSVQLLAKTNRKELEASESPQPVAKNNKKIAGPFEPEQELALRKRRSSSTAPDGLAALVEDPVASPEDGKETDQDLRADQMEQGLPITFDKAATSSKGKTTDGYPRYPHWLLAVGRTVLAVLIGITLYHSGSLSFGSRHALRGATTTSRSNNEYGVWMALAGVLLLALAGKLCVRRRVALHQCKSTQTELEVEKSVPLKEVNSSVAPDSYEVQDKDTEDSRRSSRRYSGSSNSSAPTDAAVADVEEEVYEANQQEIIDHDGYVGVYTGPLLRLSARPHGKGRLDYTNGGWYEGDWRNGRWKGQGRLCTGDGDLYEGAMRKDHKHGSGTMRFADGRVFTGQYVKGQMTQGKMIYQDGSTYEGTWADGMRDGRGKCVFTDESVYEGEFWEGEFHGRGKMTWSDGGWYEGEWCNGEMQGHGKEIRSDGTLRHEGQWSKGQPMRKKPVR